MFTLVLASCLMAVTSSFIVCPPNACDNIQQEPLNCLGGVLQNAGWCGCTDACARVEGESCTVSFLLGVPNTQSCGTGLVCKPVNLEGHVMTEGRCVKESVAGSGDLPINAISKRSVPHCDTACRKKTTQCTTSFVIYQGQWFSQCDLEGNFLAEQCDNQKYCFCVDRYTGAVQEDTKVLGSANCA